MALNNYGRALGQLATESVKGSVKGFAMGIKGAALSEMPGLTAMYGLGREVKSRADKLGEASAIDASVKEQRTNNIISIEMVRQLRSINNNVLQQTRISALQANNAKQTAMFAEEQEREKAQRDKELLDAIKSLKGGGASGAKNSLGSAGAGGGKGFLGSLFDAIQSASLLESIAGALGAYGLYKGGKTVLSKGGGTPSSTGGGGKVIPFPQGGRGGTPPTVPPTGGGGGGGLMRGAAGLGIRTALRFIPYVGLGLLAAELGYEAYKLLFGSQGGQGPNKKISSGGGLDYSDLATAMQGAPLGDNALGGGLSPAARKVVTSTYGLSPPKSRSVIGADTASFISGKEGFRTKAYSDAGKFAVGYGHSITDAEVKSGQIDLGNGEFIKVSGEKGKDTTVTKEQADKLFSKDLKKYESIVVSAIGQEAYNKLSQNQKTAILSYVYNVGSVPKGFADAIKTGNYANAAASIRGGIATASGEKDPEKRKQIENSLKKRRKEEGDLFDTAGPATTEQRRSSSGVLTNTSAPTPTSIAPIPRSDISGTTVSKPVSREVKVADDALRKTSEAQLKASKVLVKAAGGPGVKSATERLKETQVKENKDRKYLREANQTFLNQFQSTTQRLLSETLYKAIVVGAYGKEGSRNLVSRQEASGEGYRGGQLSNLLKLPTRTEKILTSAFGKKLGQAYAPMISQLGTAYLEVGARQVGRSFFAGILGNDEKADSLTGQILGNFAKGNKQAATEQLLYGLTGVASGPETIFAKYGFNSSQQGTNFLGAYGAAQITAPLAGMMGGKQPTYTGPYGQGTFGAGQTPMIRSDIAQPGAVPGQATFVAKNAAGNDQTYVNQALAKLAIDGDPAARKQLPSIAENTWNAVDQAKQNAKVAEENFLKSEAGTDSYRITKDALDQANLAYTTKSYEVLQQIAKKPVGGGSSAGGTFMSNMGNFAFDLGTSLVANKLTQGIKNPYLKAFANYGITSAAGSFIKRMIFGAPTAATGATLATGATPALFTGANMSQLGSSFMSSSGPGFSATAGQMLTNAGYTTAGSFMSGVQTGINTLGTGAPSLALNSASTGATFAGEVLGEALPYAQAIIFALKGDYKKAATTAAGTYAGSKIGFAVGGPVGAAVGAVIGSILGSMVGRKPKPAVLRVTSTSGNEVSAVTAWSKDSPPEAFSKLADLVLSGLLNSAKLMQQQSGVALPFSNIGIYVDSVSGISLNLYQEGEATNSSAPPKWSKNFGSIKDFKLGTAIVGMIEFMRDCLKEGKDAITADKLDQATKDLKSKNIQTLTSGVLNELKPGGQYDLTKGVGYSAGKPAIDGVTLGKATSRDPSKFGISAANAPAITPGGTNIPAANLTSSAETKTLNNNSAPINSVVAVGGKTDNDNSTNVTNINQMSPMNDPWRQPAYNTSFQLTA